MNTKYDGLIFDMDGVLVNVTQSYREAIRQTAEYFLQRKVLIPEVEKIKNKPDMNNDWDATYMLINRQQLDYKTVKAYFQKIYLGELIDKEKLLISKQILKRLKNKYKKIGIATGRPRQEAEYVIQKNNLGKIFDCIVAMEDVVNSKPAPDSLLAVIKMLNLKQAFYIGDSPSDVQAAEASGIPSIYVGNQNIGIIKFKSVLQVINFLL